MGVGGKGFDGPVKGVIGRERIEVALKGNGDEILRGWHLASGLKCGRGEDDVIKAFHEVGESGVKCLLPLISIMKEGFKSDALRKTGNERAKRDCKIETGPGPWTFGRDAINRNEGKAWGFECFLRRLSLSPKREGDVSFFQKMCGLGAEKKKRPNSRKDQSKKESRVALIHENKP